MNDRLPDERNTPDERDPTDERDNPDPCDTTDERDVTVRETTPGDAEGVRRVARDSWHAAYDDLLGEETVSETVESWFTREKVVADVERSERPFFVAESDGETLGFAISVPDDEREATYHLYRIYVRPDAWGEGIGSLLLGRLEDEIRARGATRLRLTVLADNENAVQFYESRGFERIGEARDEKFDLARYVYRKELD
ncbi:GNAT family N-acetyltransferase [Halorussus salinisoli]|uniref:GNAT family N-acetyltransferase n=1 Tax=Halorussus salinisoli TaxID=2558242 RepID=UPI0010C1D1C4|nr:GNAT family N-acetyltransferase [Halorussus salinisoli]